MVTEQNDPDRDAPPRPRMMTTKDETNEDGRGECITMTGNCSTLQNRAGGKSKKQVLGGTFHSDKGINE